MNYFYYQTKTKFINTGDALINKALLDTLREYGQLQCNCSKEIPDYFIKELGIKDDEKIETKSELGFVLDILKKSIKSKSKGDKVFIVSGLGHNFGGSLKKCVRNLIAGMLFPIYRLFGVKIVRIGMSIGPVTKLLAITEKIRSIFINYYYVRDTQSLELCKNIGIKKAKICPDMSWLYLKNEIRNENKNNTVIVNLRSSILHENSEEYVSCRISTCREILQNLNDSVNGKLHIIFTYQVLEDEEYTKKLYEIFKDEFECEFFDKQIRLEDAEVFYSKATYNISNRMHSLLLGYKYGALPIALIDTKKHVKIQQTLVDCGLPELAIDIYNGKKEEIVNIIENKDILFDKLLTVEKNKQKEIIDELDKIVY